MSIQFRIIDNNLLFDGVTALTASTADANFPVTNLAHTFRSKVWRTTSVTSQSVVMDFGAISSFDSFAAVFDPMSGSKFTSSAVFKIQANATNVWTAPSVDVTLSYDATYETLTYFWSSTQTYRYARFTMTDPTNTDGYLESPKLVIGLASQLTQVPDLGFQETITDRSVNTETAYGHRYSDTYPARRRLEFTYTALSDADLETLATVWKRVGNTSPIFVGLDTSGDLFDKDRFAIYGYISGDFKGKNSFLSYFDSALTIEESL
jgi:hypothetical protein